MLIPKSLQSVIPDELHTGHPGIASMARPSVATCSCGLYGPMAGKMFLVAIDAHSKWPEVVPMQSTSAA